MTSSSKLRADHGRPPIIPDGAQKTDAPAATATTGSAHGELPLPYDPWQGESFAAPLPPARRERPLPLARALELRRRPWELSVAPALFLPSCGDGSLDGRGCTSVSVGAGMEAALLYRVIPFFGFGAEAVLSGFGGQGHGALSSAGGGAQFGALVARAYFAEQDRWDPYASLSVGYGSLELRAPDGSRGSTSGWGGRVAGGLDYLAGSHFRFGPTLGFAQFIVWSERDCSGDVCRERPLPYGRLLGFATFGLRVSASWGKVL